MTFLFFYFFIFLFIQSGYFLGKTTQYEFKEIRKYIEKIILILIFISYIVLFYLNYISYYNIYVILLLFIFFIFYVISLNLKLNKFDLIELHNFLFLGVMFNVMNYTNNNYMYLLILFSFAKLLENSLNKFIFKKVLYELIIYLIIYLVFNLIFV